MEPIIRSSISGGSRWNTDSGGDSAVTVAEDEEEDDDDEEDGDASGDDMLVAPDGDGFKRVT